jgi:lipoate synthase
LTEKYYAQKSGKRKKLRRRREKLASWLRKKAKGNLHAQELADKVERCRRKHRCKSGACPECADAAQRLFVKAALRYLKGKTGVVCVTIVPPDGTVKPGGLS